jgi:type I restriction enzyme R subunit
MRAVKSRNYFEQMKGRGVRVIDNDSFRTVTPDAKAKERFVIVDAVGVTEVDDLNETSPMDKHPSLSLEKLLKLLQYGKPSPELISTLISRLSRLNKKLSSEQKQEILKLTNGKSLTDFTHNFAEVIDPDKLFLQAQSEFGEKPTKEQISEVSEKRMKESLSHFIGNSKLISRLPEIKKETEIIIDDISLDVVEKAGFSEESTKKAKEIVGSFKEFIEKNKKQLQALELFYQRGNLRWKDLKELTEVIKAPPYCLTTGKLWQAYKHLEERKVKGNASKVPDLISILRFELGKTKELEPYLDSVDKRFNEWLARQKERGVKFTSEQEKWLERIKDHIATSVEITQEDFENAPFEQMGGLGKAHKVFGLKLKPLLYELNENVGG